MVICRRAALAVDLKPCSLGRTVREPTQTVVLENTCTTVSPMSLMRIVKVGTARRDHKIKKALLEFAIGVKSPYPILNETLASSTVKTVRLQTYREQADVGEVK